MKRLACWVTLGIAVVILSGCSSGFWYTYAYGRGMEDLYFGKPHRVCKLCNTDHAVGGNCPSPTQRCRPDCEMRHTHWR